MEHRHEVAFKIDKSTILGEDFKATVREMVRMTTINDFMSKRHGKKVEMQYTPTVNFLYDIAREAIHDQIGDVLAEMEEEDPVEIYKSMVAEFENKPQ
jgi:ribosome-binding factor A